MTSGTAYVWVRSADGDLVRSDVITWLRCRGSWVEGARSNGGTVRLAGAGCPPDFHMAFLRELERHSSCPDDRWVVIISSEVTADGARWVSARLDELAETGQG